MSYTVGFDEAPRPDAHLLGGKGAGLARMVADGIPVPPGFVITTTCGRRYLAHGGPPGDLAAEVSDRMRRLGDRRGRRFGDAAAPLLVSVRSGAPVSMPGMMDTVLNVGLTAEGIASLVDETGDARFAYSCFERLLDTFARTVRGIDADTVEDVAGVAGRGADANRLRMRCDALLDLIADASGTPFPDARGQLAEAVDAVFRSWNSRRAKTYRRHQGIDSTLCTAVVVQSMVFGNRGDRSGTGVAFTRDPATGAPGACGEFLLRAQGEDVVSGECVSRPLSELRRHLPAAAGELDTVLAALERAAGDMCDVEFTVEQDRLWILQSRIGQRSGRAALRIAVEMAREGLITAGEAVARVERRGLAAVSPPSFAAAPEPRRVLALGVPSSPGAATGIAAFDPIRAQDLADAGEQVVLIRPTTSPADVHGLFAAVAVVTGRGGPMSHAAVVARGLDRPAVCGVGEVVVAADGRSATIATTQVWEGEVVSVDGDRGVVASGAMPLRPAEQDAYLRQLLEWCATMPVGDALSTEAKAFE